MIAHAHLDQANRHIEAAQARLAWLEDVIRDGQGRGLDTSLADALMHNMMATLCTMVRHRLSIRRNLAQTQASGPGEPSEEVVNARSAIGAPSAVEQEIPAIA